MIVMEYVETRLPSTAPPPLMARGSRQVQLLVVRRLWESDSGLG